MRDVTTGLRIDPPAALTRLYTRLLASREPLERSLIGRMVLRFDIIDGSDRAAVLALNALLSLIPLAVLGVAIAHVTGVTSGNYADGLVRRAQPARKTAQYVRGRVDDRQRRASARDGRRASLGLLWTAFGFTSALWRVYDRAWGGHSHAGPRAWMRGFAWLVLFTAAHTIVAVTASEMGNATSDVARPCSPCS